ncbi:MAG: AMP-binding protein [Natronohydrobacter sp.]|nr:AMP-binding protein [Natronohydrobacter sp.]
MSAHGTLMGVFLRFAASEAMALRTERAGDLSYKALSRACTALAVRLSELDGEDRSPVLIYGHRDPRYIVGYWACLLTGRAVVPVEPDLSASRIAEIARMTGARRILLGETPTPDALTPDCARMVVRVDLQAHGELFLTPDVSDDDVAYILFSSGTTGKPKGIAVTYANLADFTQWCRELSAEQGGVRAVTGNVRYCFDVSLFEMWMAWNACVPMVTLDHRDLWNLGHHVERLADVGVDTWVSTPALAAHFCKHPRFSAEYLPDLKVMFFCGEVLATNLVAKLFERFPGVRIINAFGPTEATVAVTSYEVTRADLAPDRPIPIGAVRPGTSLSLDGGEIIISGRSVAKGYIGADSEAEARFFNGDSYRTGDWGREEPAGLWHFVGRRDREVKLDGYRIDLNAVEQMIRTLPGVADAVVEVTADKRANTMSAFVLCDPDAGDLADLAATLGDRLAPHMVPRFWRGTAQGPFNPNGKLDRKAFVAELTAMVPIVHVARRAAIAQ